MKAIEVNNLGKQYRLGFVGTGMLGKDLQRRMLMMAGREDPWLKVGEEESHKDGNFWALKDMSFSLNEGEVLGILGKNGAGKSTLLKILSRTTTPTVGNIRIRGRLASLLEVGTGFHPELSGRDNIFLNGAILGMSRKETKEKFDEIVDFSGVEKYIDTPVKRYSSGMYTRLAFAVAAHLEPDILIVDEVLAVGDLEFQKKALGKMQSVSRKEGRTVIFVSHNMQAIQKLCSRCLLLENGVLGADGPTADVTQLYLKSAGRNEYFADEKHDGEIYLKSAIIASLTQQLLSIRCEISSRSERQVSVDFSISTPLGIPVAFSSAGALDLNEKILLRNGLQSVIFDIDISKVAAGSYNMSIDITEPDKMYFDRVENCLYFEIGVPPGQKYLRQEWNLGNILLPVEVSRNV